MLVTAHKLGYESIFKHPTTGSLRNPSEWRTTCGLGTCPKHPRRCCDLEGQTVTSNRRPTGNCEGGHQNFPYTFDEFRGIPWSLLMRVIFGTGDPETETVWKARTLRGLATRGMTSIFKRGRQKSSKRLGKTN